MKANNIEVNSDNGSISIVGNKNSIEIMQPSVKEPKRSFLFEVCKMIAEKEFEEDTEYSIKENANWFTKIEFNGLKKYGEIFDAYSFGREDIEDLLNGYPYRTKLVRNFKTLYLNTKFKYPKEDNDYKLDKIFEDLCKIVDESISQREQMYIEERNQSVYQLMFYAFTKCQILEKPPKEMMNDE